MMKLYDRLGGAEGLARLVDAFYDRVAADPDLAPIFPDDFTEVKERQFWFLSQFFGGPPLFSERRGQPMLPARHQPFPITPRRAQAWLRCMAEAMEEIGLPPEVQQHALTALSHPARRMINRPERDDL